MEQCVICHEELINQVIGIPEHCEHEFCFDCLVNWSKQSNSCPIDRLNLQFIFKKYSTSNGRPYAKVDISNTQLEILIKDNVILCDICNNDTEEEYHPLLTCNQCRKSYHEFCLNSSDISTWICPSCEYNNEERPELKAVNNSVMVEPTRKRIRTLRSRDQGRTGRVIKPCRRLQHTALQNTAKPSASTTVQIPKKQKTSSVIIHNEAVRRIAASGLPVLPSPRSTALINQAKYMSALQKRRKLVARLPSRIPIKQFPRIQRRTDAPLRPQSNIITQKSKSFSNASFIDKLLHSQSQLYSLKNIQIQGANIKLSQ